MFARWLKKKLFVFVVLAFALCLFPTRAFAAAEPDETSDELVAGYIEQRFNEELLTSEVPRLRARPSTGLTGNDATVYQTLKYEIARVAAGERSSTVFEISMNLFYWSAYWSAEELGVETVEVDGEITAEAAEAAYAKIDFDLSAVMNALLSDCAYELYWYDKTYEMGVDYPELYLSDYTGEWTVGFESADSITIAFPVSADYSVGGKLGTFEVDTSTGERISEAVMVAKSVVDAVSDRSAYDQLEFFKDEICYFVDYDHDAAQDASVPYGDPWQLINVFDFDKTTNVVCEGYAKAFQYLCDLANIPDVYCYTVTGTMNGGTGAGDHMWNLVRMDDKRVYLVDVTNCDEGSVGYPDELFIAKYLQVAGDGAYYVGSADAPVLYIYDAPTLSTFRADELAVSSLSYGEIAPGTAGTWGSCSWEIDTDGNLTVYPGTGANQSSNRSPWYDYRTRIKSVTFAAKDGQKVVLPANCSYLFAEFSACESFDFSGLDTSALTNASSMFSGCSALTALDVSDWDTSSLTYALKMFYMCDALETLDVSGWDTSSLVNAQYMFGICEKLGALDVSDWDTSNVTDMAMMFTYCKSLTLLDVSRWDTSNVTSFQATFNTCEALTSLDVSKWDTSSATSMLSMFLDCRSLTSLDVSGFDVSHVKDFRSMFDCCLKLTSLDLSNWDTSSAVEMNGMFSTCGALTELDLSNFDVSHVRSCSSMFSSCSSLRTVNLSGWVTSSLENMKYMFSGCKSLVTLDLSGFDTSHVNDIEMLFLECSSLVSVNLTGFDTHLITNMSHLFSYCESLKELDLSSFDTSSVTDMSFMFYECYGLELVNLSSFDTGSVTTMRQMFDFCRSLKTLDLSGFANTNVTDMSYLLRDCSSLTEVDLTGFGTANVRDMFDMFAGCKSLTTLDLSGFDTRAATDMGGFFDELDSLTCFSVGEFWTQPTENGYWSYPSGQWRSESDGQIYEWYELAHRPGPDTYTRYIEPYYENIEWVSVFGIEDQYFTGLPIEPVWKVLNWDDTELTEGVDYEIAYENNVEVGTATVIITGIGRFRGTTTRTFEIERTWLADVTVVPIPDVTFTGEAFYPTVTLTHAGLTLVEGRDYTVDRYQENIEAGEATVWLTGIGNFDGTRYVSFRILPQSLVGAQIAAIPNQAFTGTNIEPTITVTKDGRTLEFGPDYWVSYKNNVGIGTALVRIDGMRNYEGTITTTFEIVNPIVPPEPAHEPGWAKDESGAWVFYDDYGNMMCDHWESYGGAWYYFGADGRLVWNGWSYYKGVRYYMGKNGQLTRNTWAFIDGKYYYIGSDYRPVVNGWVSYGGKWYYMDGSGNPVVNDWINYQGTWYHFSASGVCDRTWKG